MYGEPRKRLNNNKQSSAKKIGGYFAGMLLFTLVPPHSAPHIPGILGISFLIAEPMIEGVSVCRHNNMKLAELQLLLFATSVASIKVFSFNSTDDNDPPSSAVFVQSPPWQILPEKFTVCFSMKQDKIDGRSPLLIRDKHDQPWIALSIWNQGGQLALWVEIGKTDWKTFHVFAKPWKFWSHICGQIDTVAGNISVSIDGRPSVTKTFEKLKEGKPMNLDRKLEIGVSETDIANGGNRSFRGKVSNVHIFNGAESTETLSKKPCDINGSYLAWSDMTFKRNGDSVLELEETEEEVCSVQPNFYNVLLPGKLTWVQANHLCQAFGGGTMTEIKDHTDMETFASQIRKIPGSCPTVWLPLSDEKSEGVWENTNLNSEAKFLKWADGQPNGFQTQNYAALVVETLDYRDFNAEESHCATCTLNTKGMLTLRGACKGSYLGEKLYLFTFSTSSIFSDTTYMATHDGTNFKFSGSFHTNLW